VYLPPTGGLLARLAGTLAHILPARFFTMSAASALAPRFAVLPLLALLTTPLHAAPAPASERATSGGPPLEARLSLDFGPGGGSRTLVRGTVAVPPAAVRLNPHGFYNLALSGVVKVAGRPYDRFGYRFDVPASSSGSAPLTLLFERPLRPGRFQLELQVEDLQSGRRGHIAGALEVPRVEMEASADPQPEAPPTRRDVTLAADSIPTAALAVPGPSVGAAAEQPAVPAPVIRLLPPPSVVVGKQRFSAIVRSPAVTSVAFVLDGRPVLTRSRPPYSVELDLGDRPELHRLRVEARDAAGAVVGTDEAELNGGGSRFAVRLVEPAGGSGGGGDLIARVEVEVPGQRRVDRVELFLDERQIAVWRQPPYRHEVAAPGRDPALLRAVAFLTDGTSAEDSRLLNAPLSDVVDVDLVELYTAVVDRRGRPVQGLAPEHFRVYEEGSEQRLERFEEVDDLPVHVALVLDSSASMTLRMAEMRAAALEFLQQIVTPRDRVTLITFDNAPRVRVGFTSDLAFLANGLEGLEARGGTALYDSLVFALEQLEGIEGQRVVVLLSDGIDERSRATEADVLELARRSAVTLYTVGLEAPQRTDAPTLDKLLLRRLADETGGRCFFVRDDGALRSAYAAIEREVRSRYLLAYYSSNASEAESFRLVDVAVERPALVARTIRGYYP
jgi:Ca-activated chloride channel family protein